MSCNELIEYIDKKYTYTKYEINPKIFLMLLQQYEIDFNLLPQNVDLNNVEWSEWDITGMALGEGIGVIEVYMDEYEYILCYAKENRTYIAAFQLTEEELFEIASDIYNGTSFEYISKDKTRWTVTPDLWNGGVNVFASIERQDKVYVDSDEELEEILLTI